MFNRPAIREFALGSANGYDMISKVVAGRFNVRQIVLRMERRMTSMLGIIHGRTIELAEDSGIADGQQVQVDVRALSATSKWGEGILRSAGGWCDHPELDEIMQAIQEQRQQERRCQTDLT